MDYSGKNLWLVPDDMPGSNMDWCLTNHGLVPENVLVHPLFSGLHKIKISRVTEEFLGVFRFVT
jgi:hypothetical protein